MSEQLVIYKEPKESDNFNQNKVDELDNLKKKNIWGWIFFISLIVLIILILCQITFAFNCETHQYICQNNYNYQGDCCKADREYTPGLVYHHCTNNGTDCRARTKALEFYYIYENKTDYINETIGNQTIFNKPIITQININPNVDLDIYYHLMSDSESPAHWYSLSSNDHSKFETCVNEAIIHINENHNRWKCSYDFLDKYFIPRHLEMDGSLFKYTEPVPPVITLPTLPSNDTNLTSFVEVKKGLWSKFMDWLRNLF